MGEHKEIKTPPSITEYLEQLKREQEAESMKGKCIVCGHKLNEYHNYCPKCGNGTERLFNKPSIKYVYVCVVCGTELDIFDNYCYNCGQRIRKRAENGDILPK